MCFRKEVHDEAENGKEEKQLLSEAAKARQRSASQTTSSQETSVLLFN
jgi:hypothetical protein